MMQETRPNSMKPLKIKQDQIFHSYKILSFRPQFCTLRALRLFKILLQTLQNLVQILPLLIHKGLRQSNPLVNTEVRSLDECSFNQEREIDSRFLMGSEDCLKINRCLVHQNYKDLHEECTELRNLQLLSSSKDCILACFNMVSFKENGGAKIHSLD